MLYIVILSKSNINTKKLTENCLKSIAESDLACEYAPFSQLHTIVVESGERTEYQCNDIIAYDQPMFNYNHACNLALDFIRQSWQPDDWVCFMNNDIECSKDWIKELAVAKRLLPNMQSLCPNVDLSIAKDSQCKLLLGYMLKKTFYGCCFLMSRQALETLAKFDEAFSFYFQDDDIVEQLRMNNIQHGVAIDSHIHHLGQATTGKEDFNLLLDGAKTFIAKYSLQTYIAREAGKCKSIDLSKIQNIEHK